MRTNNLPIVALLILAMLPLSASGDTDDQKRTPGYNPIVVESQIRDISIDGDVVTIHLQRQPYDFVAKKWTRVRSSDARVTSADDLEVGDSVRVEGDLDHQIVYVRHVVLQQRIEHRR